MAATRRTDAYGGLDSEPVPFLAGSGGSNGIRMGRQSRRGTHWAQRNVELDVGQQPDRTVRLPCRTVETDSDWRISTSLKPRIKGKRAHRGGSGAGCDKRKCARYSKGKIMAAGGFEPASCRGPSSTRETLTWLRSGRHFLANPDLAKAHQIRVAPQTRTIARLFYTFDAQGYTDYPCLRPSTRWRGRPTRRLSLQVHPSLSMAEKLAR